jgi:hypothetical protein
MLRGPCELIIYSLALGDVHAHITHTHTHIHTHTYIHIKYVFYVVNAIAGLRLKH